VTELQDDAAYQGNNAAQHVYVLLGVGAHPRKPGVVLSTLTRVTQQLVSGLDTHELFMRVRLFAHVWV
jgi:hypothetical protein